MTKIINRNNKLFWENTGNKIICPYSRKQCLACCPLHALTENKEYHIFYCGGERVIYDGNNKEEESQP